MNHQRDLLIRRASSAVAAGNFREAGRLCAQVFAERRHDPDALAIAAQVAWAQAEFDEAVALLQRRIKKVTDDSASRIVLGNYFLDLGRSREAMQQFDRVLRGQKDHPQAVAGLAHALLLKGDLGRARERLTPFIGTARETTTMTLIMARIESAERDHAAVVVRAERYVDNPSVPHIHRNLLLYLMGQSLEAMGQFDRAFAAYRSANAMESYGFDPAKDEGEVDRLIAAYSPENLARLPRSRRDSGRMIFIVGRPRSGSTLVERILGAHPAVHTAGETPALEKVALPMGLSIDSLLEYPECVADLDQDDVDELGRTYLGRIEKVNRSANKVTDKHLYTWRHLGAVELLLPQSRIIDLRRDAVDNCLSCYTASLGPSHPYGNDLRNLGLAHRQYERLMMHWHEVLTVPILKVDYEALVADTESWSRKIVEFCELDWRDDCLRFYDDKLQKSTSASPTLSREQVRQPVYKTSVGRAERFAPYLGPLLEALAAPSRERQERASP